jgi:hypothetical protein
MGLKSTNHICKFTDKVSFNSEAIAMRKVNKYDDIQRTFFCDSCSKFHLTSREYRGKENYKPTMTYIKGRINYLTNLINKYERNNSKT